MTESKNRAVTPLVMTATVPAESFWTYGSSQTAVPSPRNEDLP
jgi:hypothetical protein